jgi:hypothetical protein
MDGTSAFFSNRKRKFIMKAIHSTAQLNCQHFYDTIICFISENVFNFYVHSHAVRKYARTRTQNQDVGKGTKLF